MNKTNQTSSSVDEEFSLNTISFEEDYDHHSKRPLFDKSLSDGDSETYDDDNDHKPNDDKMARILEEKHYLENKCHETYLVQRQISILLKEFYKNCQKQMRKYCDNLVDAHKCLLIAGEEQNLIKRQIEMLSSNDNNININSDNELFNNFWPNLFDRKQCIAIKSVSIKLREPRLRQIFLRGKI
ncbi:hypothetical protein BLA29_009851 [Euroglyphus maynei]|uniref:Uncharacterized protein n=1 Tax=Euroglyphus maynei TaxID=6958 RepID=A0A1Y3B5M6_EURMA|nr:hypothetical protein BLA29_009851 [Euroglyphus maynei]